MKTPAIVEERTDVLAQLQEKYRPAGRERSDFSPGESTLADEVLLEKARSAANGAKFRKLFDEGDISDYVNSNGDPDHSSADFALMQMLAFWSNRDPEQMEALFSESALGLREKWTDRADYRERTIEKAIAACKDVYTPGSDPAAALALLTRVENGKRRGPCHLDVARMVLTAYGPENILHDGQGFWLWSASGVWNRLDDREVRQSTHKVLALLGNVTRSTVDSVLDVSRTEAFRAVTLTQTQDFVNALNGELHWSAGGGWEIRPHDREHFAIAQIPVVYDHRAVAPRFEQFLREIFSEDDDADQKRRLLLELVGYSLLPTAAFEKFALLIGPGANGKSIVLSVIQALLGHSNCCAVQPSQFSNRFQRAHMHGKLANIVTELAEGSEIADAELKAIVSGETITAEHKLKPPFDFVPTCTVWLATNHMPHTRDFSEALFRRAAVLTFNRTFTEVEQDKSLKQKLSQELPGILALALDAFGDVLRRGSFTMPPSVLDAREAWRLEADQVAAFLEECVERKQGSSVSSSAAYHAYRRWAEEAGIRRTLNRKNFTQRIERHGFKRSKGTGGTRMINGMQFTSQAGVTVVVGADEWGDI